MLYIVIPFFAVSIIARIYAKHNNSLSAYNSFAYVLFLLANIAYSSINKTVDLLQITTLAALTNFYLGSICKKTNLKIFYNLSAFAILSLTFIYSYSIEICILIFASLIILFTILQKISNNLLFLCSQVIPIGIIGLFITDNSSLYALLFMTFFGSIRYFIESKNIQANDFLIQLFLTISIIILDKNLATNISNLYIYFAGFTIILLDLISRYILRNDKTLFERQRLQEELDIIAVFKLVAVNIIAVILIAISHLLAINYIYACVIILLMVLFIYSKLWYDENEYK